MASQHALQVGLLCKDAVHENKHAETSLSVALFSEKEKKF
jgi:hypothetical protein